MEAAFGESHVLESLRTRGNNAHRVRIGQADILAGEHQHAPEDEARLLAGVDHPRQPVERGVRIGPAQALDEGADRVVVNVAFLVVEHGAALDALFCDGEVNMDHAICIGRGRLDCQLQRVEQAARVAVGYVHQMLQRGLIERHVALAVAASGVGERLPRDGPQFIGVEQAELKDAAAANQRLVDLEIRVFRGRADQDDGAVFHPRQQRVLLRLVEAVDFVHEQDGALPELAAPLLRHGDGLPDVVDAGQHRVDGDEVGAGGVGDDTRQGRFAGARRAVEDHRTELVGLDARGGAVGPARRCAPGR